MNTTIMQTPTSDHALSESDRAYCLKRALEWFIHLSASSVGTLPTHCTPEYMERQIREDLTRAGKDLSALDPAGKKSASEMEQALKSAVVTKQVIIAGELFKRLCAADTSDYGYEAADRMARDIRAMLENAGKDLSALDPAGKKSAIEMERIWEEAFAARRVEYARRLFARLCAGDTAGFFPPQNMTREIRKELEKAGKDLSALDPAGKKSASEMERAMVAAEIAADPRRGRA